MSESKDRSFALCIHLPQPGDQDTNLPTQSRPTGNIQLKHQEFETLSTVRFKLKHSHLGIINSQPYAQDPEAQLGPFKLFLNFIVPAMTRVDSWTAWENSMRENKEQEKESASVYELGN